MRSCRKWVGIAAGTTIGLIAVCAELPSWSNDAVAGSTLENALFRIMAVPGGVVTHLRPPWESRSHLNALIQNSPRNADLYSLRAQEDERGQQYVAAEADWRQALGRSSDKLAGLTELADFYHRRVEPDKELDTLLELGAAPAQPAQRFELETQQAQWAAFGRAITVTSEALLPPGRTEEVYEAWIRRYPKQSQPYQAYLNWAIQQRNRVAAASIGRRIKTAFPDDVQLAVSTDAYLARVENGTEAELAAYSKNFSPFWPDGLRAQYFQALKETHQLRNFLGDAQQAIAAHPLDLAPVLRVYFYYEQQNRKDIADQQLLLLLSRREAARVTWTPDEFKTLAPLLLRVQDYDDSARAYYMLYELPSARAADRELALASIISLLLDVPEQPVQFGNRDLSLYKNIGQIDRHPGFLNGILSVALNTTFPDYHYQNASQNAVSYFHRASASRLMEELKRQFPNSQRTAELEAKLFHAYAVYGQYDAVIRLVPAWLSANPNSSQYIDTALLLADAYVVHQDTKDELALYDQLLKEFADKSGHMPIGMVRTRPASVAVSAPSAGVITAETVSARSPDYTRILDRYISRLVQLNRPMEGIALFRREIDRNPDDPGIYERLALFVEQNRLDRDLEQTYRQAFARFKDLSWASKLARFYLRKREDVEYRDLARQITETFRGSEVASFLSEARPNSHVLFRQINLYAHQRFPHNMSFVHNLLQAYKTKETYDVGAYENLLRENWFYDPALRTSLFEHLSSAGKLRTELAELPSVESATMDSNLAALEFRAEGHAWLTDYEAAAPAFVRLAQLTPGDHQANERAISVERSLGPGSSTAFDTAIRLAEQDMKAAPSNREAIMRIGEIYADREMYSRARPWWNRVAVVRPGMPDGYLDSASVFWDYFQFNYALRVIADARQKLGQPARFGYEVGAIYENLDKPREAVAAYIQAALHDTSEQARSRLITLAQRKVTGALVEEQTANLTAGAFDGPRFELRLAILEALKHRHDIQNMLANLLPRASAVSEIDELRSVADRLGFDDLVAQALERMIVGTTDPVEKIQARLELARFYETHNHVASAEREYSSVLGDHPDLLGVVRAAVDFRWREKQWHEAVSLLEAAAERAQPPYQDQFRREAAQKASDSGEYVEARRLLDQLLTTDPYNGDLLAQKAETYARQNNNSGLVAFYATELKTMQAAPLAPEDKTTRIAALRRGYIAALTATGQFTDALEQYQQILNAYPEDRSVAEEAARYAENHQLATRLTGYYAKASQDSPRDYRWPLVLARIETALRQYAAAIASFGKAAYVRPDRSDFLIAKADLETRLLRFDESIKTYQKLYELTYHDTQYLTAQATAYARKREQSEALRLLRAAYIEPHPREPAGYISAMQQAEEWHMFDAVDQFWGEVRPLLSGNTASTNEALHWEAVALTSLHRPLDAISTVAAMIEKPGETQRFARDIGATAQQYLTPQEKLAFAQAFDRPHGIPPQFDRYALAEAAGFPDIKANLLLQMAKSSGKPPYRWPQLNQLQSSRLLHEQLGHELEDVAANGHYDPRQRAVILAAAFRAYETAGDEAAQLRLTEYGGSEFPRLFVRAGGDLASRLADLSTHYPGRANSIVQYLIANGPADTAAQAIAARGRTTSGLWINSYTALAGLYLLSPAPWATQAFDAALGPRSVAEELSAKSSNEFLRGANWFYYAARYGDYLGHRKQSAADDYLAAIVEANPAGSNAYVELAETYKELKQTSRAGRLYRDALQLTPDRADLHDRLALLSIGTNRNQAIADWRHAFQLLADRVEKGRLAPDYWQTAQNALAHMNHFHLVAELKPDADNMLRAYAKRNGAYNFAPFLQGIFDHAPDSRSALDWVLQLSQLPNMEVLVGQMITVDYVPLDAKETLYRTAIERARKAASSSAGQEANFLREELKQRIIEYARYLETQRRWAEEWATLQEIQATTERPPDLMLSAGAQAGHLDELLKGYRANPGTAPTGEQILEVAASLQKQGHQDLALQIEEFEYARELQGTYPVASAWFGLAQVRFKQNRTPEGLALIRDVTLSVGGPFENLPEAVRVLEKAGLTEEAARYADEWNTAEPWNSEAQLVVARLKADGGLLEAIRRSSEVPYSIRVRAARLMRDARKPESGSDELALLTHPSISSAEASQPFFIQARLDAARQASSVREQIRLYREAIALDPALREIRLNLSEAAFSKRDETLGLAAFNSYGMGPAQTDAPARYGIRYPGDTAPNVTSEPDNFPHIEELAAQALIQRRTFPQALRLYEDLLARTTEPVKRAQIEKIRDSVNQQQELAVANARRCPVITQEITQPVIVKPKLAALPEDWSWDAKTQPREEQ